MSGARFARTVDAGLLDSDRTAVERAVVAGTRTYEAEVSTIAANAVGRISDRRSQLIEQLRERARTRSTSPAIGSRRTVALLLAYLTAAGGFAFYFSRADFDLATTSPLAMAAIAASAALYGLACAPLRRSAPPPAQVAFAGQVLVVLTGATVGFAAYLLARFEPEVLPWLAVGAGGFVLMLVMTVACALLRGRQVRERPIDDWDSVLRATVQEERRTAVAAVREAYDRLPEADRTRLQADRVAAIGELSARGRNEPITDPVGLGIVSSEIARAARVVGVRDLGGSGFQEAGDEEQRATLPNTEAD